MLGVFYICMRTYNQDFFYENKMLADEICKLSRRIVYLANLSKWPAWYFHSGSGRIFTGPYQSNNLSIFISRQICDKPENYCSMKTSRQKFSKKAFWTFPGPSPTCRIILPNRTLSLTKDLFSFNIKNLNILVSNIYDLSDCCLQVFLVFWKHINHQHPLLIQNVLVWKQPPPICKLASKCFSINLPTANQTHTVQVILSVPWAYIVTVKCTKLWTPKLCLKCLLCYNQSQVRSSTI